MAGTLLPSSHPSLSSSTVSSGPLIAYNEEPVLCLPNTIEPIPLPVVKLERNTNLDVPPLNAWSGNTCDDYMTSAGCSGSGTFSGGASRRNSNRQWRFSARTKDGFESLRLADRYIDAIVGGVDVVAEAETLKKLIATPFSKQPLSLIVHKIGKTVLLDNCAYLRNYAYTHPSSDDSPVAEFLNSKPQCLVGTATGSIRIGAGSTTDDIIADMHREMITENLYTKSLASLDYRTASERFDDRGEADNIRKKRVPEMFNENGITDPLEGYPYTKIRIDDGKVQMDAYGRIWNFYDLNMLVDVNLPIFGCKSNPCVTLHPKDLRHRPINFLTGVDLYLDQTMCNAPEALLCWHMGGYVQEYELIRTEDIPHLENSKFDPLVLRNVAENIVAFLQDKVTHEGHTYWLCHDKGENDRESLLRLWDLTPLCGDLLEDSTANPFTLCVAVLMYKVARNLMRRSAHKRPKRIANAAFRLLNVCLGIIDRKKHPQVVSCVHYLLANLYLSYGCDALKRSDGQEEELERTEPLWAYDDEWQREYGEKYANYAAISIEQLKKTQYTNSRREKPPKIRNLPNCATVEDCCKEALEHCLEGLRYMDLFDELEQEAQLSGKPLNDPMSFIRDISTTIDRGREEADAALKVDVRSILFIRAGSAYRMLADSSFMLSRYGRTLRYARIGLYCCLAVLTLNAGLTSGHSRRNVATARALFPTLMCHIAEALGNIACSSLSAKDRAKADLKRCYRDKQIKAQALACLKNKHGTIPCSSSAADSGDEFAFEIDEKDEVVQEQEIGIQMSTRDEVQVDTMELKSQTQTGSSTSKAAVISRISCTTGNEGSHQKAYISESVRPYSWAFPKTFHLPYLELLSASERASAIAIKTNKKIAPISLFPPTADAILSWEQLARRLGNLKNCMAMHHIQRLKAAAQRSAQNLLSAKELDRGRMVLNVEQFVPVGDEKDNTVEPEEMVERTVEAGKELLLQGVTLFNSVGDRVNEALLLSNIGQLYRLQLHCQMYFTDCGAVYNSEKEKNIILQSIEYYQQALTRVTDLKNSEIPLFENISKDLAGAYMMYAIRLQDDILPRASYNDSCKISIEVREFLTRAHSAYSLIRDSSDCSQMHGFAEMYIVEIMCRFGILAQKAAQRHGTCNSFRKEKDCMRQAVEHYNACSNYVLGRISATAKSSKNNQRVTIRECMTAVMAIIDGNRCMTGMVTPTNASEPHMKMARRTLTALFIKAQPLMEYLHTLLVEWEKDTANKSPEPSVDYTSCRETLHRFVQFARMVVKVQLQWLMNNGNSTTVNLWKETYRHLLLIETTNEKHNLSLCVEKLIDCAQNVKNLI